MQHLRIRHLRLLDVIHATGSLRRAASELCVTQPAVTAMLKEVEKAFGGPLVIRSSHGAMLTGAGKALRIRLSVIFDEIEAAASESALQDRTLRLKVGAMKATMFDLVPSAVSLLYQQNERIEVKLMDGSIERVVTALLENEVDCIVGRLDGLELDAGVRESLFEEELFATPLGVACSRRHPLARRKRVGAAELAAQDWILLPASSQTRMAFNLALVRHGLHAIQPVVESESLATNFHMVASSSLLTVAPRSAIALYRDMGIIRELPIDFPLAISPLSFFCHQVKSELHAIRQFRLTLQQAAANLVARHEDAG